MKEFFEVSLSGVDGSPRDVEATGCPQIQAHVGEAEASSEKGLNATTSLHSHAGPDRNMQLVQEEPAAFSRIRSFCSKLIKQLAPPLLREYEIASKLRGDAVLCTPRRITRNNSAGLPPAKQSKKASAVENVLMKALGLSPSDFMVDDQALLELQDVFDSPMKEEQLRVVAAILGKTLPSAFELAQGAHMGIPDSIQ
jgi:hypothetical protein